MLGKLLNIYSVFKIQFIREKYSQIRFYYFLKKRELNSSQSQENILKYEYSKNHFANYNSIPDRIQYLINLLAEAGPLHNSKLLVIGPRYESELFGYLSIGIQKKFITAIDLFSNSPMIQIGDAHNLNFSKSTFDFIVAGWTIPYSKHADLFLRESHRVMNENGKLLITFDLRQNLDEYLAKMLELGSPLIPLVNGKNFKVSKCNQLFSIFSFKLTNVKWKGAKESTSIGCIVLQKKGE